MTIIESTRPTTGPDIGQALRQTAPCCICGRCLADEDYSITELALDACMNHMLEMIRIVETSTRKARRRTWVSLRTLHELIGDARRLLCMQRQAARQRVATTTARA